MLKKFSTLVSNFRKTAKKFSKEILFFVDRKPLLSFFISLGVVIVLIFANNLFHKAQIVEEKLAASKTVSVFRISSSPKVTVQAKIKKSGVIQISSQVSGIVNNLNVTEGSRVKKGSSLLNIASNYYGGSSVSLSRKIAQRQFESINSTYQNQVEIIQKQKELAQKSDDNSDQLRDITSKSNDETNSLIDLNQQILNSLDDQLKTLNLDPATNKAAILSTQQLKLQYQSAINQAKSSLRSSQLLSSSDSPSSKISDLTREITTRQLEIQEKQLAIGKEISKLQLDLARVNEGAFYPVSPFAGVVQKVYVKPFENVSVGTPLLILSQNEADDPISAVALVSKDIAQKISKLEPSLIHLNDKKIEVYPIFISTEAVAGSLYEVNYILAHSLNKDLVNEGYLSIEIPIGYPDTTSAIKFVPIDAIYQSPNSAYVFTIVNNHAKSIEVKLGDIYGRFVQIQSGLSGVDSIILDRNVIDGDVVQVK
jgi:multidrug efflux pump subunit AcrA (membrane-fusion protein)